MNKLVIGSLLVVATLATYTRTISGEGQHRFFHDTLIIDKPTSQDCFVEAKEIVSSSIYFDIDEVNRLKDFEFSYSSVMDIEIPMEIAPEYTASYRFPAKVHKTFVSEATESNSKLELSWSFPFHVRYHLVHDEPYKTVTANHPALTLVCSGTKKEITDGSQKIDITVPTITREWEEFNSKFSLITLTGCVLAFLVFGFKSN